MKALALVGAGGVSLGFALGVFAAAGLDRRAAFRQPDDVGDLDGHGWTRAERAGLERNLLWRWPR